MKKFSMMFIGAVMAAGILTGCGTAQTEDEGARARKELNDFIVGSRSAENIEKTGDAGIDALADNSTILYKRVGGAMREYIEKTRGNQAVIDMSFHMTSYPGETDDNYIKAAQEYIMRENSVLTDTEKQEWTAEKLFKAAEEKNALHAYLAYEKGLKKAENKELYKKDFSDEKTQKQLMDGKAIHRATLAKEDWSSQIDEMKKLLGDTGKVMENTAVFAAETNKKLSATVNSPTMHRYLKETAALKAQKTFAGDARKKEIDAEIDKIASKAEYKPTLDEAAKLKKDLGVLTDGIGTQMNFTGKAIPWLIEEYTNMMSIQE